MDAEVIGNLETGHVVAAVNEVTYLGQKEFMHVFQPSDPVIWIQHAKGYSLVVQYNEVLVINTVIF
jgi:hypothetical protein